MAALLFAGDGSFSGALLVFGAMAGTAGLIALFLRPPVQEAHAETRPVLGWVRENATAN